MSEEETGDSASKRKGAGGRLGRSETVSVRLDARLRYMAELAARKQRRTLSSFIEWAIEETLKRVSIRDNQDNAPDIWDLAEKLWDVDEADRFAKLALNYPELLTYEEQILWKFIRDNGYLWRGYYNGPNNSWAWQVAEENLIFDRLRDHWGVFNAVAKGEMEKSKLPTWVKEKAIQVPKPTPPKKPDLDDEIPF